MLKLQLPTLHEILEPKLQFHGWRLLEEHHYTKLDDDDVGQGGADGLAPGGGSSSSTRIGVGPH